MAGVEPKQRLVIIQSLSLTTSLLSSQLPNLSMHGIIISVKL